MKAFFWIFLAVLVVVFAAGGANSAPIEILNAGGYHTFCQGPTKIFQTFYLRAYVIGDKVFVEAGTNYPPDFVPADLNFRLKKDGRILVSFKMGDGRVIPFPKFITSEFLAPYGLASRYTDGAYIPVQARGNSAGQGETKWERNLSEKEGYYIVTAKIPINAFPVSGKYEVEWATAFCGNCVVHTTVIIPSLEAPWGGGPYGAYDSFRDYHPATPVCWGYPMSGGGLGGFGGGGGGGYGEYDYWNDDHYYVIPPPPCPPPATPIPGTFYLFGLGIVSLLLAGIRREVF
ncbi:MAG: hypothetical protein PHF35_03190 [Candidatus Moranbacteria bacterium]|nr:hypothetical protein [Candidatus Moranbacteria bacterium]